MALDSRLRVRVIPYAGQGICSISAPCLDRQHKEVGVNWWIGGFKAGSARGLHSVHYIHLHDHRYTHPPHPDFGVRYAILHILTGDFLQTHKSTASPEFGSVDEPAGQDL